MRKPGPYIVAAAVVAAAFAVSAPAQAAGCPVVPASYDAGAAAASFPNDPLFDQQWGLTRVKAPQAWALGALGSGATIAIVDTGVDLGHPDLVGRLVPGANFTSGETCDPGAQDLNGHGTHVAGIAAASTNNGIGVAGTAPLASIMPVRVLRSDGSGSTTDIVSGIDWAVAHGAQVINMSLASDVPGFGPFSGNLPVDLSGVSAAIQRAHDAGVTVVVAAGTGTFSLCSNSGTASEIICVAAINQSGFPSTLSNFPASPMGVALRAPGGDNSGCGKGDIWSTYWGGAADDTCGAHGYEPRFGTSSAAPFVSGVAALLRGAGVDNDGVSSCLEKTSSNNGSYDAVNGYGIVNAQAAVAGCAHLPPPVTQPTTTGGGTPPPTGGTTQPGGQGVSGQQTSNDTVAPRIRVAIPNDRKAHAARAGYVSVRVRLSEPARATLRLMSGRESAIAGRNAVLMAQGVVALGSGRHAVKLKLTGAGRRILRHHRSTTVTLLALARDAAGNDGTAISEGRIRR